jgi:glycosyltransferase involved in cell wall biosynthesis
MANSGLAWHLFAVPAIKLARLRGLPVVVNYRGGLAAEFLDGRGASVARTMRKASALVVPTGFLKKVFADHGMEARIIPNVVDVSTFRPAVPRSDGDQSSLHVVVTRNLERLYGIDVALRAFALVRSRFPAARLSIAGSGPELGALERLANELGLASCVRFTGRLDLEDIVALYHSADLVLNPSRADNTPNSVLEALACGLPVVSTNVGGVPYLVQHGVSAILVPPDSPEAMSEGVIRVLGDAGLRARLIENGLALAQGCAWLVVRDQWLSLYAGLAGDRGTASAPSHQVP